LLIARRFSGLEIKPVSFEYHYPIEDEKDFAEQMSVNAVKSDRTRLVLSCEDAQLPLMTKSPQMWLQIEPMLEARLAALKPSDTMSARVQHELGQVLPAGNVSSHIIAKRLAVSQRTLQRRLTDEGTNFQRVLKGLRTELAKDYLKSTDLNLSEIALLLGFQDTNSFFRAFRSWTDETPNQYRSNARNKNTLIS
jgi:AraC-like DNA-binding protein